MLQHRHGHYLLLSGLLLLAGLLVYLPGLHGGFLFDDFANLPALGSSGPVNNWPTFWRYITSGRADPTGRPLALLSFLIDARNWPTDPLPFKRTNLILHLVHGTLLICLLRSLGQRASGLIPQATTLQTAPDVDRKQRQIDLAAVLGAGLWLVHPLFVSTTLYIVQREAMLPALFSLAGLLLWLRGRDRLMRGHTLRGTALITLGLGGCTLLGMLGKANGILLPALALVIEYTLLRSPQSIGDPLSCSHACRTSHDKTYRNVILLLGWLPALLTGAYLLHEGWNGMTRGVSSIRPWTLGQRLLTEPRVLMDYLGLLWLPRPFTPGLFNDHIQVSTSLLSPPTTLLSAFSVSGLIVAAWVFRRRWPAFAAAVLFYFVGQSLESTTVALELFYEHRNYLPAMLMFWPLALWLSGIHLSPNVFTGEDAWRRAKLALAAILIAGLGLMTYARAGLWGNTADQTMLWARLNPDSPRAQASAAQMEMDKGAPDRAVARLQPMLDKTPDEVQIALNLLNAECQLSRVSPHTLDAAKQALRTTRDPGTFLVRWFEPAIARAGQPPCTRVTATILGSLLQAALENPKLAAHAGRRQDLAYLQGLLDLGQNDGTGALVTFNRGLDQKPNPAIALRQAALLGSAGFIDQAIAHLDYYQGKPADSAKLRPGMPRIHAWVLTHQHYWQKELSRLRATLRDDAAHQSHGT